MSFWARMPGHAQQRLRVACVRKALVFQPFPFVPNNLIPGIRTCSKALLPAHILTVTNYRGSL